MQNLELYYFMLSFVWICVFIKCCLFFFLTANFISLLFQKCLNLKFLEEIPENFNFCLWIWLIFMSVTEWFYEWSFNHLDWPGTLGFNKFLPHPPYIKKWKKVCISINWTFSNMRRRGRGKCGRRAILVVAE